MAASLESGSRLGKYEIIRPLAMGGMAELFLARAHGIEDFVKVVVLKRILPEFASNERFVTMFLDEARLAGTLQHANVAQVYDIGQDDGSYYFTMEYVHGCTLLDILRTEHWDNGLALEPSVAIMLGLTSGLHYAHQKTGLDGRPLNLVHRDVSPSNVMVTYDGTVKLVDFGIAKATMGQAVTQTKGLTGKLRYMSPEQVRGVTLDRRSDVFAAGVVLFEMTTGTRLYGGESESAITYAIAEDPPTKPSTRLDGYPPELERIVLRALHKDRDERYQSALDLHLDLERFATSRILRTSGASLAEHMNTFFGPRPASAFMDVQSAMKLPAASNSAAAPAETRSIRGAAPSVARVETPAVPVDATSATRAEAPRARSLKTTTTAPATKRNWTAFLAGTTVAALVALAILVTRGQFAQSLTTETRVTEPLPAPRPDHVSTPVSAPKPSPAPQPKRPVPRKPPDRRPDDRQPDNPTPKQPTPSSATSQLAKRGLRRLTGRDLPNMGHFDPIAYAANAQKMVRQQLPDARLVQMHIDNVSSSGHANLSSHGSMMLMFRSRKASRQRNDDGQSTCLGTINLIPGAPGILNVSASDCQQRIAGFPKCSSAAIMKKAAGKGAPKNKLAQLVFFSNEGKASWIYEAQDFREILLDDCPF